LTPGGGVSTRLDSMHSQRTVRFALLAALAVAGVACEKKQPAPATGTQPQTGAPQASPAAPAPPAAPAAGDRLLVGEVFPLTGGQASFGISARNASELAVREANAAGGVRGKQIETRVYDSQGKPEEAAQAITRLITQDQVLLVLGDATSSNAMAMAEKAQAAGVPMLTPTATAPAVTEKGDHIFRVCFIDPFQGGVMARFAREHLKAGRVAILEDNKSAYSIGLTETFTQRFKELGGQVVATESYSQGDTDFRAQLTAIRRQKPDAVYVPGYYNDVGVIGRQARELGLKMPLMGGDGWDSEKLFELAGDALDGSYFSNHYSAQDPNPRVQDFIRKYKEAYGNVPDALAALGYDGARVALAAIERAASPTRSAIRDALAQTKDFPGVTGNITLDDKRNAVKPAVVLKVAGGKYEYVTTIAP
jgi:branched-chain amino acid transport system substrate-binding protein